MDPEEWKISVWVCQEEKLVSGLSKRTTCADVIRALLFDQKQNQNLPDQNFPVSSGAAGGMLVGSAHSYCIVEKWRGFERILPNKTKILRLWLAWGDEQDNVRFVLVKNEASLPNNGPRSAEARVVLSKESPCGLKGTARATMALPQEKQRRIVRKAFRKLAKINRKRQEEALSKDASSVEKMETLVHLVLSQDHTIRQQIQRIKELDNEIDRYESKVHFDRMKRHGVNYVQDTYLSLETDSSVEVAKKDNATIFAELEEYAKKCEELLELQQRLSEQEEFAENIAMEIQEELNQRWMKRRQEELSISAKDSECVLTAPDTAESHASSNEHLERVKTQLSTSLYIGLRLNTDLESLRNDLDYYQKLWDSKDKELRSLIDTMNFADLEEERQTPETGTGALNKPLTDEPGLSSQLDTSDGWVEEARGLSKMNDVNDEDSDTGLSSMHSQDSDTIPICESLV